MNTTTERGGFTLPVEAGYEELTLELARRWGADVIRDSDGTKLSPRIVEAGYRIYSTVCVIREHNAFAEAYPDAQQQTFLSSEPVLAEGETVVIEPLKGYFAEQFRLNDTPEALPWWQVWDRTADRLVPAEQWRLDGGKIVVGGAVPGTATPPPSCAGASGRRSTCTTTPPTIGRANTCASWTPAIRWPGNICKSTWTTGARPIHRPMWCG